MTTTQTHPNTTRAAQVTKEVAEKKLSAQAKPVKPAKEAAVPKDDPLLAKKVKLITEGGKNPKREGSASHARFALYKNGMTVAQYMSAITGIKQSAKMARADIKWDEDHKFIVLTD